MPEKFVQKKKKRERERERDSNNSLELIGGTDWNRR
jgi:hypothetical protein